MQHLTPMLKQYFATREAAGDAILFFRLGDFYEMFGDDAVLASRILEITLTSREAGRDKRMPMCGVPFHSADRYIARLVEKGYSVAVCEQVEDPREAKGLVRREIIKVVTPGTIMADGYLDAGQNNYLMAICQENTLYGLAYTDLSTAEFRLAEIQGESALQDEFDRLKPAEVLLDEVIFDAHQAQVSGRNTVYRKAEDISPERAADLLCRHFGVASLDGFGCGGMKAAQRAAAVLLQYLNETQKQSLSHITSMSVYSLGDHMSLDRATVRSLELSVNMRDGGRQGTLISVLDQTVTPMGSRLLKRWVQEPLLRREAIEARLDAVAALHASRILSERVKGPLESIQDLERLLSRITLGMANARDIIALKNSLKAVPAVVAAAGEADAALLRELAAEMDPLEGIISLVEQAISDDPPAVMREGGVIRDGYHEELDRLRSVSREGKGWLSRIEGEERERTGIKNLKIGFNQVFGYYIEITRSNLGQVPENYIRKQTLANAERYITPDLKEYESMILNAEERMAALEQELFSAVRESIIPYASAIQKTAAALAAVDVLLAFAWAAGKYGYCRPEMVDDRRILVRDGRHPVVERGSASYVANDTVIGGDDAWIMIITGPNMAGKSTYLRQVALISLMAQMGSFVPAGSALLGVVDRVFCRVGAHDDLASGQSTFMVEMTEMANILNHATERSLVLIDELGRGTSTYDGMSIAWAIVEALHELGTKTLFATHYHQLNQLEGQLRGIRNYRVLVREDGEDIIFLHRITEGGTDRSYGIEVARLAGVPAHVVLRSREILHELEDMPFEAPALSPADQLPLFSSGEEGILGEIRAMDIYNMSPIEAMNTLHELKGRLKK